ARRQHHAEGRGHADRRRASNHQRPDRRAHFLPRAVVALDLVLRQHGLIDQDEPVGFPADRRDDAHAGRADARRLRISAAPSPATSTIFSRVWRPCTTLMDDGDTPSARAKSRATAAFAAPSTGGAVTRSFRVASCQPTISSREARGWTRRDSRAPSALDVVLVLAELGGHHAVVALERRAEVLDELPADTPQRLDLAPDPRLFGAPLLDDLLAAQLGLAHLELGLAPRRRFHLVAQPVGGDQRVLQRPLAVAQATGPLLEERVDLVGVEAPQPLDGELLLANVERTDAHRLRPPTRSRWQFGTAPEPGIPSRSKARESRSLGRSRARPENPPAAHAPA